MAGHEEELHYESPSAAEAMAALQAEIEGFRAHEGAAPRV